MLIKDKIADNATKTTNDDAKTTFINKKMTEDQCKGDKYNQQTAIPAANGTLPASQRTLPVLKVTLPGVNAILPALKVILLVSKVILPVSKVILPALKMAIPESKAAIPVLKTSGFIGKGDLLSRKRRKTAANILEKGRNAKKVFENYFCACEMKRNKTKKEKNLL